MKNDLETMRHSAAHLLAAAVKKLYPKTSLGIGPVIENGFYYDFDMVHKFTEDDLKKMEKEIKILKSKNILFERIEKPINEAAKFAKKINEPYKEQLIADLKSSGEKKVSFYKTGDFIDLCTGPHLKHSGLVGEVRLTSVAGAYWKGSEANKMLQRIYGTAWFSQKDLTEYLDNLKEIKKRDHKILGPKLELYFFHETSPGMPHWLPKGTIFFNQLLEFSRSIHKQAGYAEIMTPILNKKDLYVTSGHWKYYLENMFVSKTKEKELYGIKAMNCPNAMLVFASKQRSYRDLPLRLLDMDRLHRFERSGTLNGLFRVREFSQDDAHIFVLEKGIQDELSEIFNLIERFYSAFKLEYSFRLGTRPEKYMGDLKSWKIAEAELKKGLVRIGREFVVLERDGTFYGPKIDILMKDSLGRTWQMGTIQIDFNTPKNFKLKFTDSDGKEKTPLTIHRAIYGSFERFIGIIIEHFGGNFPLWLSPVQVKVIPIAQRHVDYANLIVKNLSEESIRAGIDDRNETMQSKLRDAQIQKIPYMLIIGDKEKVQKSLSLRSRERGDEGVTTINKLVRRLTVEIKDLK